MPCCTILSKLKSLNTSTGTLRGKINTSKLQVCGHPKGGGGALWASSNLGSGLASTVGMAPWQEEFVTLSGIRATTLIQAGLLDPLATAVMTMNEYNLLPGSIKMGYFVYTAADHMSWASMGLARPALSQDGVAWMKYYKPS
ncbi:MAG: hypothetical protein M0036_03260 [Desulfobacteraceae bacterium]|nr:hypothetical protein [Desulfobacteraceae bacterium]